MDHLPSYEFQKCVARYRGDAHEGGEPREHALGGQLAVVTGQKDISSAAKVVKNFGAEFDRLKVQFGYLNNQRLEQAAIVALADLPSLDVLRATLLGLLNAPATKLVVLLNTPATQLARVIKAKAEKS